MALDKLQYLFSRAGLNPRSYSGRAMYGKSCLGVEVDSFAEFMANVLDAVTEDELPDVSKAIRNMRTDSMGRGMILYFPNIPYEGQDENADSEYRPL